MTNVAFHRRVVDVDAVTTGSAVEGLLVPWDSPAWVADDLPDGGRDIYQEGFRRCAFNWQFPDDPVMRSNAPRVIFRHMHSRADGFGPLGIGREFAVRDDGLWASFRIIKDRRDTLAELIDGGIKKLSVEFRERPNGTETDDEDIRWRTDVLLDAVALEWKGAYPEAQVLAMRQEIEEAERERVESQQAAKAEAEAEAAVSKDLQRVLAEIDDFVAAAQVKQAELMQRFGLQA